MRDRRGNLIRFNVDVDPSMLGVEYADTKKGNHIAPRTLRYLRRDMARADSLGRVGRKITRHMSRRYTPAA